MYTRIRQCLTATILTTLVLFLVFPNTSVSQSRQVDDLRERIEDRNERIKEIEEEIAEYQKQIAEVGKEKVTLQSAVQELQLSERKLQKELELTLNQLHSAELTIEELDFEIKEKELLIKQNYDAIAEAIRKIHEQDNRSLIEVILAEKSLSDFWASLDTLEQFQIEITSDLNQLASLKVALEDDLFYQAQKRDELSVLENEISGEKEIVEYAEQEKNKLLEETENKESNYRSILQEKIRLRDQFQQELQNYETQLKIAIDPDSIPQADPNVLSWPLDNIVITQHFGNTAFAQSGAYNGKGHNGVDFGAPIGTPVKSAQSGKVLAVGDTDNACSNASYGRWIVIQHTNGLSSLYAHLSVIGVSEGQSVARGQVIGRVGNTGYSTGPHLHFTVYATQGMKIGSLQSSACPGAVYRIPLADLRAYLNPLQYLQ